jgi:hypothetical protein
MSKEIVIKITDNTVAVIENECVSIVQKLFTDSVAIVLSKDDIYKLSKILKTVK